MPGVCEVGLEVSSRHTENTLIGEDAGCDWEDSLKGNRVTGMVFWACPADLGSLETGVAYPTTGRDGGWRVVKRCQARLMSILAGFHTHRLALDSSKMTS
jgi:hypothetical protein